VNNSIKDWQGNIRGFRCFQCGGVFDRMWGTTCNSCIEQNDVNQEMIKLKKREVEALEKLVKMSK